MTRSEDVFLKLHELSLILPDMRPGQILALLGISKFPDAVDPFNWESDEWEDKIDQVKEDLERRRKEQEQWPSASPEEVKQIRQLNEIVRRLAMRERQKRERERERRRRSKVKEKDED